MIKTATNATFIVMTKAQAAFMQALNIVVALKNKNTTMLLRQKSPFALSLARCIVLVVIFLHCCDHKSGQWQRHQSGTVKRWFCGHGNGEIVAEENKAFVQNGEVKGTAPELAQYEAEI